VNHVDGRSRDFAQQISKFDVSENVAISAMGAMSKASKFV